MKPFLLDNRAVPQEEMGALSSPTGPTDEGVQQLKDALVQMVPDNTRAVATGKPFLFAVDHCFPIKGQGTVMTGTVLQVRLRLMMLNQNRLVAFGI